MATRAFARLPNRGDLNVFGTVWKPNPVLARGAAGEDITPFVQVMPSYGQMEMLAGSEVDRGGRMVMQRAASVTVPWCPELAAITSAWQWRVNDEVTGQMHFWDVESAVNLNSANLWLVLLCREVVE